MWFLIPSSSWTDSRSVLYWHMACSEGHVRKASVKRYARKNTYSRKHTIGHGEEQGKILSPLLYKVYADNLLQKLEDSGQGVCIGTTFVGSPTCDDDVLLVSSKVPDMQGMVNINQSYSVRKTTVLHALHKKRSLLPYRTRPKSDARREQRTNYYTRMPSPTWDSPEAPGMVPKQYR